MTHRKWLYYLEFYWSSQLGIKPYHFLTIAQCYWSVYKATSDYLMNQLFVTQQYLPHHSNQVLFSQLLPLIICSCQILPSATLCHQLWSLAFLYTIFVQFDNSEEIHFLIVIKIPQRYCWIRLHLCCQSKSDLSKLPGGGKTTLVFCMSRLLGESGNWLLILLSVSTVSGTELMIPPVSVSSVLKFSSTQLHEWTAYCRDSPNFLAPKLLPYVKEQVDYFPKWSSHFNSSVDNVWIVQDSFHLVRSLIYFSASRKLVPLSDLIDLTGHFLDISLLKVWISESMPNALFTSTWATLIVKHINRAQHPFKLDLPSLML